MVAAGLNAETYEETPGWAERVDAAFSAIAGNSDTLVAEMGEPAAAAAVAEALLTLQIKPYPRRIHGGGQPSRLTHARGQPPGRPLTGQGKDDR